MPNVPNLEQLAHQARFIFKGTVIKLKGATMKQIPVNDRTAVVRVDEIVQAPPALSELTGQEITVQLGGRKKAKKGDQAVFYTNGWVFGESVAVQSLDHFPPEQTPIAMARAAAGDPVKTLAITTAQARFASADTVVSGRVVSVKLPPQRTGFGMMAAAGETTISEPISEHDPQIQEAEIEIDAVHKGSHAGNTARLRFPNSQDVKWYKAPKFRAGNEGVFMLHKDEAQRAPQGARAGAIVAAGVSPEVEEDAYTALHPADFQPSQEENGVMEMIAAMTATTPEPKPE